MLQILDQPVRLSKATRSIWGEGKITLIVPAYNEADSIAHTIASLLNQTLSPSEIIVVDDCSTDVTGDVARSLGVTVLRPPKNRGSKAGAQTYALPLLSSASR